MSNGSFGGVHQKILDALPCTEPAFENNNSKDQG
jgi:hypothetical protein